MRFVRTSNVDEILVAEGADLTPDLQEALLDCQEIGVPVVPLSLAYERLTSRLPVAYAVRDLGLIANADDSAGRRLFHVAKRIIDLGLALVSLLGMVLLVPFIALGNALTSPGPLFYRQQRVGRGGEPFVLIKFRTMVPEAEAENGAVWAAEGDPRTTPVGRWLRRTHLDELPQVINLRQTCQFPAGYCHPVADVPGDDQAGGELISGTVALRNLVEVPSTPVIQAAARQWFQRG
jgi:hypothetical protein